MAHSILLGFPGPSVATEVMFAYLGASRQHRVRRVAATRGDNLQTLWVTALNAFEAGEATHYASLHSDVCPPMGWLDSLAEVMDRRQVAMVSAAIPIKDERQLLSCGIGDPDNPWFPLRRLTVKEALTLPPDFDAADLGYPGLPLLHNNGCFLIDLRFPQWLTVDATGELLAQWKYMRRAFRNPATGKWDREVEGEDWYFSRMAHRLGLPSAIAQVPNWHRGEKDYPSDRPMADGWEVDEETRSKWEKA